MHVFSFAARVISVFSPPRSHASSLALPITVGLLRRRPARDETCAIRPRLAPAVQERVRAVQKRSKIPGPTPSGASGGEAGDIKSGVSCCAPRLHRRHEGGRARRTGDEDARHPPAGACRLANLPVTVHAPPTHLTHAPTRHIPPQAPSSIDSASPTITASGYTALVKMDPMPARAAAHARAVLACCASSTHAASAPGPGGAAGADESADEGSNGEIPSSRGGGLVTLLLAEPLNDQTRAWAAFSSR